MSLARSASGPGGLTINTGAANSLSAPSSQPQSTGGLFGTGSATATANQSSTTGNMATTGGLFGGAQQKPAGGGLFGATSASPAPAGTQAGAQTGTTGGGLFGAASTTGTTQQNQGTGGGLFGNAQQSSSSGGGLFGNSTATSQPQQQQQQQQGQSTGTGLFGASTAQPAAGTGTGTGTGGGLFGGASTQQQQQAPQTQQTGGGLFGASTANTQASNTTSGGGLFGQSQAKPSGGLFGQAQPQANQSTNQVPAVQINYDNLRPRSRFDDLAQPIQDEVALIDKGIQRVIKMSDEIGEFMPQHERDIEQLGRDVKFVESKFRTVQDALNRDIQTVKALQDVTKKNIGDAQLSFKATDNLKLPSHYHQTGLFAGTSQSADSTSGDSAAAHANAQDLITYFNRICDDVEKYKTRLDEYRREIERDMPGVENGLYEQIRSFRDRKAGTNGAGGAGVQDQLNQILSALRETGNAIVAQAGQIADTRERLSRLQAGFLDSGLYTMGMAN